MKIPGRFGKNRLRSLFFLVPVVLALLLIGSGMAWSSSQETGHEQESTIGHATEGGEGGHAQAGGESHGGGIHWQKTDGYRVFNFAILAIGLFLLLRKPMSQALRNRIKGIRSELESLENRKAEVEKQLADYNAKLSELDKESEQIVADYIRQGEEAKVRILKEAQSAADKLKEQAQKNIAYEFEQAKLTLQAEIVGKALAKAETLIRDQISDKDQNRLVDEYLEKVVA